MTYREEFSLKEDGISCCLAFVEKTLKNGRLNQHDLLEALLISEGSLLLLGEHAPEDAGIQVTGTRQMGVPRIKFVVPGTPLALDEDLGTVSIDRLGKTQSVRSAA